MRRLPLLLPWVCLLMWRPAQADQGLKRLTTDVEYLLEAQATASSDRTPLWLNANKFGLSSLDRTNGYGRASLVRPLRADTLRRWGVGYGVDVAVPFHFSSNVVVQQAFVEGRWWHAALTVGSKEWLMELYNNELSSGAQTLGINARPVPQVRLSLPQYWTLPVGNDWIHVKGHVAFGRMSDDNWQHDFTQYRTDYTDRLLYHSKAGYLKIGNEERFFPWSLELGLEMATQFGGTAHLMQPDGTVATVQGGTGWKDYWHAFLPGGNDAVETGTAYENIEGNQLGSWMLRLNYEGDLWDVHLYGEHFFEDHSSMFMLDYDGYGQGDAWNARAKRRYFMYDLKDMMLGAELNWKYGTWLRSLLLEYIYTKYQSGPVYHDHGPGMSDHLGGVDDYYNHGIYPGWQHWGQVMGNPLYRSPLYNGDNSIMSKNNRFWAFHLGASGQPTEALHYRLLATFQQSFGTYLQPYRKPYSNAYGLAEVTYAPQNKWRGWSVRGALGLDFGKTVGCNQGFQLTIARRGIFNKTWREE
ncbi:MAG: hypothetical protein ILA34_02080 [Bacteroidaceae bacterium]|nr:hypothetical protein [Bacteroidaceae bacterium]